MIDLVEHLLLKELKLTDEIVDELFSILRNSEIEFWEDDTALMIQFMDLIIREIKSTDGGTILHWVNLFDGLSYIVENFSQTEF